MMTSKVLRQIRQDIRAQADPAKAAVLRRFFKTGKGEYGEGDKFLGVVVPKQRAIAKKHQHLSLDDLSVLLDSPYHEERLTALLILVGQYRKADNPRKEDIFNFYLSKTGRINNWDLVDLSAYHIVGAHLHGKGPQMLYQLARSKSLWKRRIAMVATFYNICKGEGDPTLKVAETLLNDKEELLHKAAGWMLREVGKRVSKDTMEDFLCRHYKKMPRIMLRYAIERLPPARRKAYLNAEI